MQGGRAEPQVVSLQQRKREAEWSAGRQEGGKWDKLHIYKVLKMPWSRETGHKNFENSDREIFNRKVL